MRSLDVEKSMDEKLQTLYELSVDLAYEGDPYNDDRCCEVVDTDEKYGKEISDIIWGMVDGLYPNWIMKRIEGRCSLQASLDFDMSAVEKQIDDRVELLEGLNNNA